MQNNKFELPDWLKTEYPEIPPQLDSEILSVVNDAHSALSYIDSYLEDVKRGKPTGSVEYHLKIADDWLSELDKNSSPEIARFIQEQRGKLKALKPLAKSVIGKRGTLGVSIDKATQPQTSANREYAVTFSRSAPSLRPSSGTVEHSVLHFTVPELRIFSDVI